VLDVSAPAYTNEVWPFMRIARMAQKNRQLTMLFFTFQYNDLPMARKVWRFWMMRHLNGCSTPAPRSMCGLSADKNSFKRRERRGTRGCRYNHPALYETSLEHSDHTLISEFFEMLERSSAFYKLMNCVEHKTCLRWAKLSLGQPNETGENYCAEFVCNYSVIFA